MFKIIFVLPVLLLAWSTDLMGANDFYCKIDLLTKEASKDSNSQRYTVEVKGKEVRYEYSYSGFPDNEKESASRTLNDEQLSKIISYIKEKGIDSSIIEKKPNDANGPSRKVHLSLLLTLDGQHTKSDISGNYNIYRAEGQIKGVIIENKEYVDAVRSLIRDLK
ncbi:MAG: hypothetical protein K9K37_06925 [Desulfocapsa sp.]|nr:hypothetical protein [Desulfocapsa sp.]